MVNNFKKVEPYLTEREGFYYVIDIVCRLKDTNLRLPEELYGGVRVRKVKYYLIKGVSDLKNIEPEIKLLCRALGARAYIGLVPVNMTMLLQKIGCQSLMLSLQEDWEQKFIDMEGLELLNFGLFDTKEGETEQPKYSGSEIFFNSLDTKCKYLTFDIDHPELLDNLTKNLDILGIEVCEEIPSVWGKTLIVKLPEDYTESTLKFEQWWNIRTYYKLKDMYPGPHKWGPVNLYVPGKRLISTAV